MIYIDLLVLGVARGSRPGLEQMGVVAQVLVRVVGLGIAALCVYIYMYVSLLFVDEGMHIYVHIYKHTHA